MGCTPAETKLNMLPGPAPAPLAAKAPKLLFTTRTGEGLLRAVLNMTCIDTMPSGAFDGIMALIWPGPTNIGMASAEGPPFGAVTLMDKPPKVVESGKASVGLDTGPRSVPKTLNADPRAMAPPGKPGAM